MKTLLRALISSGMHEGNCGIAASVANGILVTPQKCFSSRINISWFAHNVLLSCCSTIRLSICSTLKPALLHSTTVLYSPCVIPLIWLSRKYRLASGSLRFNFGYLRCNLHSCFTFLHCVTLFCTVLTKNALLFSQSELSNFFKCIIKNIILIYLQFCTALSRLRLTIFLFLLKGAKHTLPIKLFFNLIFDYKSCNWTPNYATNRRAQNQSESRMLL